MATIVIYMTKHGTTEKIVSILKSKLDNQVDEVCNLKSQKCDISKYDDIIIGGSIHAGQVQSKIKKFCKNHESDLLNKKLGLFITCMEESESKLEFLKNSFPENLLNHAVVTGIFGGEFNFDKMNFVEKAIIKKITGFTTSKSRIDEKEIAEFAEKFSQ